MTRGLRHLSRMTKLQLLIPEHPPQSGVPLSLKPCAQTLSPHRQLGNAHPGIPAPNGLLSPTRTLSIESYHIIFHWVFLLFVSDHIVPQLNQYHFIKQSITSLFFTTAYQTTLACTFIGPLPFLFTLHSLSSFGLRLTANLYVIPSSLPQAQSAVPSPSPYSSQ